MRRSRFSDQQIALALQQVEHGASVAEVCRKLGITEQTDAVVVVVSEETGQASLVERARIRRNLDEAQLARAISALLRPERRRDQLRDRLGRPDPARLSASLRRGAVDDAGRAVPDEGGSDDPRDDVPGAAAGAEH